MNSPGILAARKLADLGYRFTVNGETIKAKYEGQGEPDPGQVRPLLTLVREHKPEVMAYLTRPAPQDRLLTCYDCGHFCPSSTSPNPAEAWGRCGKMNKGRYGCAVGCAAMMSNGAVRGENDG